MPPGRGVMIWSAPLQVQAVVWGNASLDDAALPDFLVDPDPDSRGDGGAVKPERESDEDRIASSVAEVEAGPGAPGADVTGATSGGGGCDVMGGISLVP